MRTTNENRHPIIGDSFDQIVAYLLYLLQQRRKSSHKHGEERD